MTPLYVELINHCFTLETLIITTVADTPSPLLWETLHPLKGVHRLCIGGYTVNPRTVKRLFPNLRLLRIEGVDQSCTIEELCSSFGTQIATEQWKALSFLAICLPPSKNIEALTICRCLPRLRSLHMISRQDLFKFTFGNYSEELFSPYSVNTVSFRRTLINCR